MPNYSKRSSNNLSQCHPDLQILFETVIKYRDCAAICGHRGKAEQNAAYNAKPKRSELKFPHSKHNKVPSLAADVVPYPIAWEDISTFKAFGNYVLGVADGLYDIGMIKHRIRWGGNWKTLDYPHFELIEV